MFVIEFCREFARTIPRPFSVRYNPYTQSIEVVKDKGSMDKVLNDIRYELDVLQDAIGKQATWNEKREGDYIQQIL